jgi:hypothetical protein
MSRLANMRVAYRLRWKRRELLYRAYRLRGEITCQKDRTDQIKPNMVLGFSTVRNEYERLPHFLAHHRALGVGHFFIIANDSTDQTIPFLSEQSDVSLWTTDRSYKASRFGMDWLTWLLIRFGQGRWCLTLDADELLVYPHCDSRGLNALVAELERRGQPSFGALMIDLYPKGPVGDQSFEAGSDPLDCIAWFDADNYRRTAQPHLHNNLIQGGARDRLFFEATPRRAPTMNKTPLVKWHWRYAYMNSTHTLLPPRLNRVFSEPGFDRLSGALLHTKFLPSIVERSVEERARKQHFARSEAHTDYYEALVANPDLWAPTSCRYDNWRQLVDLGLMSDGGWR